MKVIHQETITICEKQCLGSNLTLDSVGQIFQDVASHHTDILHLGYDDLIKANRIWVLAKMYYEVTKMPKVGESITIKTWSRGCNGLQCFRDFIVEDSAGCKLLSATSVWVVIDFSSRKLCRVDEIMEGIEHNTECTTEIDRFPKLPSFELSDGCYVKSTTISSDMIDVNNHVNNVEYIKLVLRCAAENLNESKLYTKPLKLFLEYVHETMAGDSLQIFAKPSDDGSILFQICNSHGVSVKAVLHY